MNDIMNEKGRQTKLLAAVAILAMVVCALAVVMPSDNVDAASVTQDEFLKGINDGVYTVSEDTDCATKLIPQMNAVRSSNRSAFRSFIRKENVTEKTCANL